MDQPTDIRALLQELDDWDARFADSVGHLHITEIYTIWLRAFRLSRRIQRAYQEGRRAPLHAFGSSAYTGDTRPLE